LWPKHTEIVAAGNELSGSGVRARIDADQYAADVIALKHIVDSAYQGKPSKPLVLASGGFFDAVWFTQLVSKTKPDQMDAITHHIYNLGPGIYICSPRFTADR
jgi:heparanase